MRTFIVAAVLVAVALAAVTANTTPNKPEWANQWDAPFGLTVKIPKLPQYHNKSSYFRYNWDIKTSKIFYPEGCLPQITEKPCNLTFVPKGCYLSAPKLLAPFGTTCCLLFPGIGSIPPNFLAPFNYNGTETVPDQAGDMHDTYRWRSEAGFQYWTDKTTGLDIQFKDGPSPVYWNYGPLHFRNQTNSVFDLPNNCLPSCKPKELLKDVEGVAQIEAIFRAMRK